MSEMLQQFFMHHAEETYSLKQIFKALRLDTHPAKMLAVDTMEDMAWDDYLSKVSENSFRLNTKGQVLTGRFLRKPNGKNSVIPDENGKPVFVAERNSMFALNGDRVQVAMMARRRNHIKEAMVTKIIERAHDSFVGKLLVGKASDGCPGQPHLHAGHHHTKEKAERRKDRRESCGENHTVALGR